MALVKSVLEQGILAIMQEMKEIDDPEGADELFAEKLATLIDGYIRTATVTVSPGQIVQTVPATGTGATTTPGTGVLS